MNYNTVTGRHEYVFELLLQFRKYCLEFAEVSEASFLATAVVSLIVNRHSIRYNKKAELCEGEYIFLASLSSVE